MAKMLLNVTFTAAEKRIMQTAQCALDDIASRCGTSAYELLVKTYRAETSGSHSVTQPVAIGFICGWFMRYYDKGVPPMRDMIGARSVEIAMLADFARHNDKARAPELEAIRAGEAAKDAAIARTMKHNVSALNASD